MVVHWPARITDTGALRSRFTHVIDVGPTILDIAGIPAPSHVDRIEQQPLHGVTFADSLADAAAPERHTQQYFEIMGPRHVQGRLALVRHVLDKRGGQAAGRSRAWLSSRCSERGRSGRVQAARGR